MSAIPTRIAAVAAARRRKRRSAWAARATSKRSCSRPFFPRQKWAAILWEPIQGEGGYVVAPDNFLRELRAICNRHGILLVVDEVQSGAGRTGKWWAIEHSGVQPDMVCLAQGIASGMPRGVCM